MVRQQRRTCYHSLVLTQNILFCSRYEGLYDSSWTARPAEISSICIKRLCQCKCFLYLDFPLLRGELKLALEYNKVNSISLDKITMYQKTLEIGLLLCFKRIN